MRKIYWVGKINTAEDLDYNPIPEDAIKLERTTIGIVVAIVVLLGSCFGILFLKRKLVGDFKVGISPKIAAGVLSLCSLFLHE